jgi:hypothetical protein
MNTLECTECGHERAAQGRCGHCGAPRLRGSVLGGMFESHRNLFCYGSLALLLALCCAAAFA